MKKNNKIITSILISIIFIFTMQTLSFATATTTISAKSQNINVGETTTISVGINNTETWNLRVTASGGNLSGTTTSTDAAGAEVSKNVINCSFSASSAGSYIITLSGSIAGSDLDKKPVTKSITINVTKPTTNPGGSTGGNSGGSTGGNNGGSTTVTEPKFTSANKTVYATGDINLRSSWSTSSSATKVSKGTELKLTGTSTQKVNGYVWYRVTYNGQTKYVSRDLITEAKPEEKEEKSNNTNLQTLAIEGVELTPTFSANVTEYSAKLVNYKEQSLKINAEAEDSKSTVKVEGNEEIKIGENVISITVTAEDGTTKVYKVTVTNEEKEGLGLSSLVIKDVELKNFSPSKFNYEIEFSKLDKLEIEAIANEEGATVEIIGNENLTENGEHVITIIVTSADGEQIATYTITANKVAVEEQKQELNIKSILICALIALVVLVAIIILIVKYVKGNSSAEVDYVYNDNIENKDENDIETKEEIEQNNEIETEKKEVKEAKQVEEKQEEKTKKPTVDDLYADYDDEPVRKRGKGRHSK